MASNGNHQFVTQVFSLHANGGGGATPASQGRQDKVRTPSVQEASPQPVLETKPTRTQRTGRKIPRAKNTPRSKRQRVLIGVWVKPRVKAELQQQAKTEGLSVSAVTSARIEEALQHAVNMQYSALLTPIIEAAIDKRMRSRDSRLAWLLVRIAFDAGQTRSLVTNILGRQPGVTEDLLKTILAMSQRAAKGNITRKTPQIAELIDAVEKWLVAEPAGATHS
jgi:hypothetical protein